MDIKAELKAASEKRKEIEDQIGVAAARLETAGVGMHGPILDEEGFPRGDLDLPAIRADRHTVITLTNDHKHLTDTMARLLEQLHSQAREESDGAITAPPPPPPPPTATPPNSNNTIDHHHTIAVAANNTTSQLQKPFATVNAVSQGSPAFEGGLEVGDLVFDFGGAKELSELPSLISGNEKRDMVVKVDRGGRVVELKVRPRVWSGRGLLGCHLIPAV